MRGKGRRPPPPPSCSGVPVKNKKLKLGNECVYIARIYFLVEKHLIKLKTFKLAFFTVLSFSPDKYFTRTYYIQKTFLKKALLKSFFFKCLVKKRPVFETYMSCLQIRTKLEINRVFLYPHILKNEQFIFYNRGQNL